jgi:hypothetical protein
VEEVALLVPGPACSDSSVDTLVVLLSNRVATTPMTKPGRVNAMDPDNLCGK